MGIDDDVRGPLLVRRRLDAAYGLPRLESLDVVGDVGPLLAAVERHMDEAVVGAGPQDVRLLRRFGEGENRAVIFDASVVAGNWAAGPFLLGLIVARQIGTDLI